MIAMIAQPSFLINLLFISLRQGTWKIDILKGEVRRRYPPRGS
jgi:hypothetical protein